MYSAESSVTSSCLCSTQLPDVCYSWWVLASLKIIGRIHWIDKAKLRTFILACQDEETGGFADRPGDMVSCQTQLKSACCPERRSVSAFSQNPDSCFICNLQSPPQTIIYPPLLFLFFIKLHHVTTYYLCFLCFLSLKNLCQEFS